MSDEFQSLSKVKGTHHKKNHYIVDRHANLENKAKTAHKHRIRSEIIDEEDDWQSEIREYMR